MTLVFYHIIYGKINKQKSKTETTATFSANEIKRIYLDLKMLGRTNELKSAEQISNRAMTNIDINKTPFMPLRITQRGFCIS